MSLFKENSSVSAQASAPIKRWSLFLSSYEYTISFRITTEHANADALSRLPLPSTPPVAEEPPELVLLIDHLEELPVTVKDISKWTEKDPTTAAVL